MSLPASLPLRRPFDMDRGHHGNAQVASGELGAVRSTAGYCAESTRQSWPQTVDHGSAHHHDGLDEHEALCEDAEAAAAQGLADGTLAPVVELFTALLNPSEHPPMPFTEAYG